MKEITYNDIIAVPVPQKTDSYTPISNKLIVDTVINLAKQHDFELWKEQYDIKDKGNKVKMRFGFRNDGNYGFEICTLSSYDKSIALKAAAGVTAFICWNGLVIGEFNNYRRHTGSADEEVYEFFSNVFAEEDKQFKRLSALQDKLQYVQLSKREMAELAGRMFVEEKLINTNQINTIRAEIEKPSFNYEFDLDTAWGLYNHTTYAIQNEHPLTYGKTRAGVQEFFELL